MLNIFGKGGRKITADILAKRHITRQNGATGRPADSGLRLTEMADRGVARR